jgi:hypothetical protein
MNSPLPPGEQAEYDHSLESSRATLGDAGWLAAWKQGQLLSLDQAVDLALSDEP